MKKKIVAMCATVALAALAVGGTLAYFTDTDEATNTFTSGKVDITLEENFDANNAKLLPGKANAVQKEVSITLEEGSEDSYVWYTYLIPADLDSTDGSTGLNNIVHVNAYGYTWDTYRENKTYWPEGQTEALPVEKTWDHTKYNPEGYIGYEVIDGVTYNVYLALYHGVLEAGDTTMPGMSQVYLDAGVDYVDGKYVDKNGNEITVDLTNFDIIVRAYGIQAAGFANVYEAYEAYIA